MGATETAPCRVVVDKKRLEATLVFTRRAPVGLITQAELVDAVQQAHIKLTPELEHRLSELASMLRTGELPCEPIVIARGQPPDPGCDGRFELDASLRPPPPDNSDHINFFEQRRIPTATQGQCIGKVYPPKPPQAGQDVFGEPIKPTGQPRRVQLGKNVRLEPDGQSVVATRDGQVKYDAMSVEIVDILRVEGDVDFNTGSIDSPSGVIIRGSVLDLFIVRSRKSIEVGGNIEAAEVHADENILVRGGICGKEKGKVTCGGELRARFCSGASIEAVGDVYIAREAINCVIRTHGMLHIPNGSLMGGRVHARKGGQIAVLGSEAGVKTHVGIGMPPEVFAEIAAIDEKVKSLRGIAEQIRTHVQPLLANLRRLTPAQREKATELMYQADDLEAQIEPLLKRREELIHETAAVDAALVIGSLIHAGISMTVDNYSLRFEKELKGPIKIEKRKVDNVTEVVGVNQISGSLTIFPARKLEAPDLHPAK